VEAFDVSQETIKIANNHLEYLRSINENLSIRYFVHDANKIELEENKYSFILIQSAIHHIENGQHILSETIKSLEKDGILLIIEHNTNKLLPKLISHFLLLILPTIPSYTSKIKYYSYFIYRKIFRIVPDYFLDDGESPFEDITPVNKVIQILNSMKIKYTIETTSIICSDIIPNIPLLKYRSILVRIVGKIDWLLNKIFLKSGQYILIRVKK